MHDSLLCICYGGKPYAHVIDHAVVTQQQKLVFPDF